MQDYGAGMGFRMTEFVLYFVIAAVRISQVVEVAAQVTCETADPGSCSTTVSSCPNEHLNEVNRCFPNYPYADKLYRYNICAPEPCSTSGSADLRPLQARAHAVALFLHPLFYTLQVSWVHDSSTVHHYEVKLYSIPSDLPEHPEIDVCVDACQTEKNFTLKFTEWKGYIKAEVIPYPCPNGEGTGTTIVQAPTNCHDQRNFTEPFECGPPRYSSPTNIQVHTSLIQSEIGSFTRRDIITRLEESNQMQAEISWNQPRMPAGYPPPSIYYLHVADIQHALENCGTPGSYCWVVNNSTSVTLKGLNASLNYTINIEAYYPCSGLPDEHNGCGESNGKFVYYPMPNLVTTSMCVTSTLTASMYTPSPSPSVRIAPSNTSIPKPVTTSNPATASSPVTTTHGSPATARSPVTTTHSSPMTTSMSAVDAPTSSMYTPSPPESSSDSAPTMAVLIGPPIAVLLVVVVVVVVVLIATIVVIVLVRRCKHPITFPSPVNPMIVPQMKPPQRSPSNHDVVIDIRTSRPDPDTSPATAGRYPVLVVYSSKSSEEDMKIVLQYLVNDLRTQHGIDVTSHDFSVRESLPNFIENQVKRASAVLCVCNEQFEREWKGLNPSSDSIICSFKLLLEGEVSRGRDLSKFAVVLLCQSHRKYIPSSYLYGRRQFLITQTEEIARFVKDIPSFEAPKE